MFVGMELELRIKYLSEASQTESSVISLYPNQSLEGGNLSKEIEAFPLRIEKQTFSLDYSRILAKTVESMTTAGIERLTAKTDCSSAQG